MTAPAPTEPTNPDWTGTPPTAGPGPTGPTDPGRAGTPPTAGPGPGAPAAAGPAAAELEPPPAAGPETPSAAERKAPLAAERKTPSAAEPKASSAAELKAPSATEFKPPGAAPLSPGELAELAALGNLPAGEALKALFRQVAREAAPGETGLAEALAEVGRVWPDGPKASIRVTLGPGVWHLHLGPCSPAHNLDAELARIKPLAGPRWSEILMLLSSLVSSARIGFFAGYARLKDHDSGRFAAVGPLRVDPANTTLYVNPASPVRIGIFVQPGDEAEGPA